MLISSFNSPSPENILDAPIENDISADIHDINLDNNDEIGGAEVKCKGPGMRHIKALQLEDEDDPMFMVSRSSLSFLTDFVPYTLCTKQRCRQPVQIKERKVGTGLILRWVSC